MAARGSHARNWQFHDVAMWAKLEAKVEALGRVLVKRRAFLHAGFAAALGSPAVVAPAIAQSAPEIRWRMTSSFPRSLEMLFGAGQTLCRYVAEATDNKFQIQAYSAGELATSRQALEAVTSGSVECAHTPLGFHANKDLTLSFGGGLPFGLNARHQLSWWSFAGGAEIINASLKKFNAHGILAGCTGVQMGGWFKREITSIDDLKGLRFRINGMGGAVLARIGVVVFDLPYADVVGALENGVIDGAEFICPHDDERLGLVKLAKYNHNPCWWESSGTVHLVVNLEKWHGLPKAYQSILVRACDAVRTWLLAKYDTVNPPALKRLIAAGAVIKPFPRPVLEACYRATNEYFAELAAKDAAFKRALDSVNAYRRDHHQWWQMADHALDDFVVAMHGRT
jgi:TRAP-type mannitol/chloroaromatic compound transport system substrate-binding protein